MGGSPLPGGQGQDHKLELGSNSFIPGFEEGIIGMKIGVTMDLHLKFPEEYHAKEIAGKDVTFKVTLKGIEKSVLPEINDELAKNVGGFDTLQELRDAILEDLTLGEEGRVKEDTRNRILKALVKENPVEVPKSIHLHQKKMLMDDVKQKMQSQGMDESQFLDYASKWDKDFDESASFMIQSSFLVDAIADEKKLRATDADFEEKLNLYSEETGMDLKKLQEFYQDPDKKANLKYQLTEEKVVDFLIAKANVKEVSKEELSQD
jgi:trigger factor